MGTMSRCGGLNQPPRAASNDRSTKAMRLLTGQRLSDVLTVINKREYFNRSVRRLVFALWRKHVHATGRPDHRMAEAIMDPSMAGVILAADSPMNVARRLMGWAARK